MSRGLRAAALAAVLAVAGYAGYRFFVHEMRPPVPVVITRDANAHRLLSLGLGARIDRFLHDRPPPLSARAGNPKLVALTFDDGPYPVETPLLLDELADLHVPATFFLIGHDATQFPELTERIERAGNEIANHTQTHPADFQALPPAAVKTELDEGAATLERYVRDPAIRTLMRPPHGRFTEATVRAAQQDGYDVVLWDDDPGDWRAVTPAFLVDHMAAHATAPDVILLHSGRLATVQALAPIVARFRAAGFSFVTVGELLRRVPVAEILHPAKLRV